MMKKEVMIVTGAGQIGMAIAELLMSDAGTFITGSTFLADGGATASYYYGPLQPVLSCRY